MYLFQHSKAGSEGLWDLHFLLQIWCYQYQTETLLDKICIPMCFSTNMYLPVAGKVWFWPVHHLLRSCHFLDHCALTRILLMNLSGNTLKLTQWILNSHHDLIAVLPSRHRLVCPPTIKMLKEPGCDKVHTVKGYISTTEWTIQNWHVQVDINLNVLNDFRLQPD